MENFRAPIWRLEVKKPEREKSAKTDTECKTGREKIQRGKKQKGEKQRIIKP